MSGNSTITLQNRLNFCSTHNDLLPFAGVGGLVDEPGLTLCNDAISEILSDPNDWKFNRVEMAMLVSCPNKQDQLFAGACIFSLGYTLSGPTPGWISQGWGIDLATNSAITVSGGNVTVTTLENHRIPVGAAIYMTGNVLQTPGSGGSAADFYNSTFTDNGSSSSWSNGWTVTAVGAKTITFVATTGQNNGDVLGAPGIKDFGYLTSATLQEINNTSSPPYLRACTTYRELPKISRIANPDGVCVLADLGNGVLSIRYLTVPGTVVWGALMVYQAKAPLKVTLSDTWAPIPDNFQALINQALLYRMYRYDNDPRADIEYRKLQAEIAKIHGTDQAEATDVNIQPPCLLGDDYCGW